MYFFLFVYSKVFVSQYAFSVTYLDIIINFFFVVNIFWNFYICFFIVQYYFKIIIKVPEDFRDELYFLIKTEKDYKLDLALKHTRKNIDWSKCDSDKVQNIRRKINNLLLSKN